MKWNTSWIWTIPVRARDCATCRACTPFFPSSLLCGLPNKCDQNQLDIIGHRQFLCTLRRGINVLTLTRSPKKNCTSRKQFSNHTYITKGIKKPAWVCWTLSSWHMSNGWWLWSTADIIAMVLGLDRGIVGKHGYSSPQLLHHQFWPLPSSSFGNRATPFQRGCDNKNLISCGSIGFDVVRTNPMPNVFLRGGMTIFWHRRKATSRNCGRKGRSGKHKMKT